MLKPMTKILATRIDRRLSELNLSARKASVLAGLHPDFVRNIQRGRSENPGATKLAALAKVLEVPTSYLTDGDQHDPSRGQVLDNALIKIAPLHIRDFVQAGNWRVNGLMPKDEWLVVDLPSVDPRYPGQPVFGVQVRDQTMSQLFLRNAILSCITTPVDPTTIEDDRIVIVERRDPYGRIERTAKQVKRDESNRLLLWERPLRDDPQAPWLFDGSETLEIIALAIKVTADI